MSVLWFPDESELFEILASRTAKQSLADNKSFLVNKLSGGTKVRLAFLQESGGTEVEAVTVVAAGSLVDLRSIFT